MDGKCGQCCEKLEKLWQKIAPWAPILCRLTLGIVFLQSGWGKLHNLEKVTGYFTELGIPFPGIQAPFVATVEFLSGLALLLGLFARFASLMIMAIMLVAIITAKWASFESKLDLFGSQEWDYLAMAFVIFAIGSGPLSLSCLCSRFCKKK